MVHSTSSSGIFYQGDDQSHALRNSHLNVYGNSNLVPQNMYSNMIPVSQELTNGNSGPGSLVTDANSGLSGGTPSLKRSASINTESYSRLPASPLSFNSNNISISGSSVIEHSSPVQQHGFHQGASTATSLPNPRLVQGSMFHGSFMSDHDNVSHLQKKARMDIKHEDILQHQNMRQMQPQNANQQLVAMYQQQQLLQSLSPAHRAQLIQQLNSRQNPQQQSLQPATAVNRPFDGSVCARRLMQFLYHQRHKPADISYWRKFVSEYYSPRAKQRWCVSVHNNVGHHHPSGIFPPANTDMWQCSICGSKSGRGFEASFEVLPRLNEIKFGSGVIDELWFLDLPQERRFPSGHMMLDYEKAVQESVYEQIHVIHEGRLKVIFSPDLKILCWEFCSRRHEELLPRRVLAPRVNQMLEVAQKWQTTIAESGSGGVSQQDLLTSSNMLMTAGRQLARSLEMPSINDLGFTKRYVRSLQIAEVVNCMKDLMDVTRETNTGPMEVLKRFSRGKSQMQKMQGMVQMPGVQVIPADRNALSGGQVSLHPGSMNNNIHSGGRGVALPNYQNTLLRQSPLNAESRQDASSPFSNRSPFHAQVLQSNNSNINIPVGYQRSPGGIFQVQQNLNQNQNLSQNQNQQAVQNQIIQQALKGMNDNNNVGGAKPSSSGQSGGGPTRSNSFKGGSYSDSCAGGEKTTDLPNVSDTFQDIASEFFNNDEPEDGLGFEWKA